MADDDPIADERSTDGSAGFAGPSEQDAEAQAAPAWLEAAIATAKEPPLTAAEVEGALRSVLARRGDRAIAPVGIGTDGAFAAAHRRWRTAALRAAAAVLVVAGASLTWRATRAPAELGQPASTRAVSEPARFASAVGELDTLRLTDGTAVVLGPGSALTVARGFGGTAREVILRGEAHFDVVHDDARPFVVRSGRATLRDVGTVFAVRGDSATDVRVWVTEGAVDVREEGAGVAAILRAGDLATVSENGVSVTRGAVTRGDLAWMRGDLVFRDAPFEQVRDGVRRWYGLELVAGDSVIAARRLTATLSGRRADGVGDLLAAALGGRATRTGDTLRITASTTTAR
jgi:ferric-dicitrate binding protein FerR (iron transport regulator)